MQPAARRLVVVLCVLSCAALASVEYAFVGRAVRTADRNGDGRPDEWRRFDTRGRLTEIDVDTNDDGLPDVEEYYERGVLVRRESDRNFNGQADLVEEFDAATHGLTRSIVDVDFDGTADLLVLFRGGQPVFSKVAPHNPRNGGRLARAGQGPLAPFVNPFQSDSAFRSTLHPYDDDGFVGLSTSGGLPSSCVDVAGIDPAGDVRSGSAASLPRSAGHAGSSRAPPAA